ncbi:MAG: 2,4-diaminopentanoate dehydrogenase [Bacillota bacterium]
MSEKVRVIHWGLGAMGSGMAKMVLEKEGMEIVGAIAANPAKVGRDLGEILGLNRRIGVIASSNPPEVIANAPADIVLLATSSFVPEVLPQLKLAIESGLNVITIAEEMAEPRASYPEEADEIDLLAKKHGVSVLGTGINPGFVLDTLIIALTGVCTEVKKIKGTRINDLSQFGATVMRTQGVGTTPEEFKKGLENGTIVGHIGFNESVMLIANALGWKIDRVEQTREPITTRVYRETPYIKVEPGNVAGCRHTARAYRDSVVVIELVHPQQIRPEAEGVETGDYIEITGTPNINMAIKPEIPGGTGTIAVSVNMIPRVISAAPGLLTMNDLPVPAALMGDVFKMARKS